MSALLSMPPLVVRGRNGYWGASPELKDLTAELIHARRSKRSTKWIVDLIDKEILSERAPTPDQLNTRRPQ